jgi:hypothetical protein
VAGASPFGLIFGSLAVGGALAVGLLGLDRLPVTFCAFKVVSGLPCPTCGSTRVLGRMFALDLPGAFAMNPLAAATALGLLLWALGDLAVRPAGRALRLELPPRLGWWLRALAVAAVVVNWGVLVALGR